MATSTSDTKAVNEYRAVLQKERDEKKRIVDDCEARLPELKRNHEASYQVLDAHVKEVRIPDTYGAHVHPLTTERDQLQATHQGHWEAFNACQRDLNRARPRLTELERLLAADAVVAQLTDQYRSGLTTANATERRVRLAEDMIAAIDADKADRAERRQQLADANAAAQIEHAEAALVARSEGKPIPEAPAVKRPGKGEETDADLDSQRSAAIRAKDRHTEELRTLVDGLVATRNQLTRARLDAKKLNAIGALQGINATLVEYEAERTLFGHSGQEIAIELNDIAVRARANAITQEIEQEIPLWRPMSKREKPPSAIDNQGEDTKTADAPSEAQA